VFYNKLEENYDVAHKYDVTLGDMNAKVWEEEPFRPSTESNSTHKESNDHGNRIANFTCSTNFTINSTIFHKKKNS
jgi:hypothetical protein